MGLFKFKDNLYSKKLTLKVLIVTAADDKWIFFYIFSGKIRLDISYKLSA